MGSKRIMIIIKIIKWVWNIDDVFWPWFHGRTK